jgi:hypothetical protein
MKVNAEAEGDAAGIASVRSLPAGAARPRSACWPAPTTQTAAAGADNVTVGHSVAGGPTPPSRSSGQLPVNQPVLTFRRWSTTDGKIDRWIGAPVRQSGPTPARAANAPRPRPHHSEAPPRPRRRQPFVVKQLAVVDHAVVVLVVIAVGAWLAIRRGRSTRPARRVIVHIGR